MPSYITHYQFGQDVLNRLGSKLASCIQAYKHEYDIGLQGPDIFFYYKPYLRNDINAYGYRYHSKNAYDMFAPILRKTHNKAALAYLAGLICHYTLDKCCHPYIKENSIKRLDHVNMEYAYDSHLMAKYRQPYYKFINQYDRGLDFDAMASLWPGMDAAVIRECVMAQQRYIRLLERKITIKVLGFFVNRQYKQNLGAQQAYKKDHTVYLDIFYKKALNECPKAIQKSVNIMGNKRIQPLWFNTNYEGTASAGAALLFNSAGNPAISF